MHRMTVKQQYVNSLKTLQPKIDIRFQKIIVDVASAQTLQEARATSALEAINQQMYSAMLGPGLQTNMSWDIAVALNFGATSRETSMTEMPLTHKKCCVEC